VQACAADDCWTVDEQEQSYFDSDGPQLRYSSLSDALLRKLGHPSVTEHPLVVRLAHAATEWTYDACCDRGFAAEDGAAGRRRTLCALVETMHEALFTRNEASLVRAARRRTGSPGLLRAVERFEPPAPVKLAEALRWSVSRCRSLRELRLERVDGLLVLLRCAGEGGRFSFSAGFPDEDAERGREMEDLMQQAKLLFSKLMAHNKTSSPAFSQLEGLLAAIEGIESGHDVSVVLEGIPHAYLLSQDTHWDDAPTSLVVQARAAWVRFWEGHTRMNRN